MIKKLTIAAAILAALVLAGVLIFLRGAGPSEGAKLVPSDAVFFTSFTDLPRSFVRWQSTSLANMAREPEIRAFLEKPLAWLGSNPSANETGTILGGLKPGRLFLAVTRVTTEDMDAVVGFQYWGGKAEFERAVERLRAELPPDGESAATSEAHGSVTIRGTTHGRFQIFSATIGRWGFLTTNLEVMKSTLERATGSNSSPTLSTNLRFLAVSSHMLKSPDFMFFLHPEPVLEVLLETGRTMGANSVPDQVDLLRATDAVGGSWKLDGKLQRDAWFFLRANSQPAEKLTHKTARFTSAETVVFVDFLARFEGLPSLLERALAGTAPQESLVELADMVSAGFGPECGVIIDWASGSTSPSAIMVAEIRDPAKAVASLNKLMTFFPETQIVETDGVRLFSIPSLSNPLATPTITLTEDFMILGINPESVLRAVANQSSSVNANPAFAPAADAYRSANELFAFVDSKAVFERAYSVFRPVIIFSARVMPGVSSWIDTSKLPQTETILRHLPPLILSQQRLNDGVLLESSGPVTVSQLAVSSALGGILNWKPATAGSANP